MYQSLTETAQEVKTQPAETSPVQTNKKDPVPEWLGAMTEEECWDILNRFGRIDHYPGMSITHPNEVARFFGFTTYEARDRFRCNVIHTSFQSKDFPTIFPTVRPGELRLKIREFTKEDDPCEETLVGEYEHFVCVGKDPSRAISLGIFRGGVLENWPYYGNPFKAISGKGVILIALKLRRSVRYRSEIANRIASFCDKLAEDYKKRMQNQQEPQPATEPAAEAKESPKLDPTQTLTQMFQAMLTLLTKESEERGAEKLIQKLKEEGKL